MIYINDRNKYNILKQAIQDDQPLDNFDTSNVTNMSRMFYGAKSFNQPLDKFDTSNVNYMVNMFYNAISMFIGYIMRFAARNIFVYNNYYSMDIEASCFSSSRELDKYIIHLFDTQMNKAKIDSALDGFIID